MIAKKLQGQSKWCTWQR